ncbi:MAG: metal-dependent hydrolase family protein [Candidatus Dormibacteria bacterium]
MALILTNARLIDGTGADPVASTSVTIEGDLIAAIGQEPGRDDRVIDLQGRSLLPGLINAHAHLGAVALLEEDRTPAAVVAAWVFEHCRRSLDLGITTVRDTGGLDGGVVAAVHQGLVPGPRLLVCGPVLMQTGGHAEFRPPFVPNPCAHHQGVPGLFCLGYPVDGEDEVRRAARLAFKRGATFLKMCVTGGVTSLTDSLEDTQFTVDEIRAAVMEARARHTYVTVHTHNNDGILRGLEAGVECFEHATALDPEVAEQVSRAGASVVPTLTVAHLYHELGAQLPQGVIDRIAGVEDGMRNAIKLGHEAGILMGAGADLIGADQRHYGMELALVAETVGAMKAIETVTLSNARVLRIADRLGSIEVGKTADLVAVDGDPLADPWLFDDPTRITLVVQSGRVGKSLGIGGRP